MNVLRAALSPLALACAVGAGACGPKQGLRDWVYESREVRFRVGAVPAGWKTVTVEGGQVQLHAPEAGATLSAFAECGRGDAPLSARRAHLLIGLTARKVVSERPFTLDGRAALRTRLAAQLDGVLVVLDIVVVKKDGCSFDLVYTAPPERFDARLRDFDAFVAGFQKLGEPS